MRKTYLPIALLLLFFGGAVQTHCGSAPEQTTILDELSISFSEDLLERWYPAVIDNEHGGYHTNMDYRFKVLPSTNTGVVPQSRHLWTTSNAAMFLDDDTFLGYATHGFEYIANEMWDEKYGGFFFTVPLEVVEDYVYPEPSKLAYGNAFAIYAFSSFYRASGNEKALEMAKKTFYWLEEHSYDREHKGYMDRLNRDGSWNEDLYLDEEKTTITGSGLKDQNAQIHILEAFTELYRVWPDSLLRERTIELLTIIRDVITQDEGYMILNHYPDWTPFSLRDSSEAIREANQFFDLVSFGHNAETGYLLLEAAHVLGVMDAVTLKKAKRMVDHSIEYGWDDEFGGMHYEGWYLDDMTTVEVINPMKAWWTQAEGLNAFLLMAQLFPEEEVYMEKANEQWEQIKQFQIDTEYGGWYPEGLDRSPGATQQRKGYLWKANYHVARSLMNCISMLRGEMHLVEQEKLKELKAQLQ